MSPMPMTIQVSMSQVSRLQNQRPAQAGLRSEIKSKLLLGSDRILGGLGYAELHHGLGLDLDRLAGLWVAAYAGFAMRLYQAAEAGNHENAGLLVFFFR